ncbi:MAG: YezD family protein [Pirellulales bacterium]|nr:YezD family protein [Pirellulales bacterium]
MNSLDPLQSVNPAPARRRDALTEEALGYLVEALAGLRFGDIRLTVQDGVVVQIERTERRRPQRPSR